MKRTKRSIQESLLFGMSNIYLLVSVLQVAWSVARTSGWNNGTDTALYPVPYDRTIINRGRGWSESQNMFTAPRAGYYYVHLSTAAEPQMPVEYTMMHNGIFVIINSNMIILNDNT